MGIPTFETYFNVYECSVSDRYYNETINQSINAIDVFNKYGVDYWLDYATLLNQLRGQTINHWDHDADFSIIHPDYAISIDQLINQSTNQSISQSMIVDDRPIDLSINQPIKWKFATLERAQRGYDPSIDHKTSQSIDRLIDWFEKEGFIVVYDRTRHLMQLGQPTNQRDRQSKTIRGPHIDVWFWIPSIDPTTNPSTNPSTNASINSIKLYTADHTVHFTPRPINYIFPLSTHQPTNHSTHQPTHQSIHQLPHQSLWLGKKVSLPHRPYHVSSEEFSVYGGSFLLNQVFRGDCFHNFFNLRWMY